MTRDSGSTQQTEERTPPLQGRERVARTLAGLGLDCRVVTLDRSTHTAHDAAAAIGVDVRKIAKTIVLSTKASAQLVIVVASGATKVNLRRLRRVVGEHVRLLSPAAIEERTGYAVGGVPPVGHDSALMYLMDQSLLRLDVIWAAAGDGTSVFSIRPGDLQLAVSAIALNLTTGERPEQ